MSLLWCGHSGVNAAFCTLFNGSDGIPLVNKAFLGSAVPERPSCIIPAAARHRFGSPARRQTGWFCDVDGTVPEKELFARRGRKSLIMHGACLAACLGGARLFGSARRQGFLHHHVDDDHPGRADTHRIYLVFSMGGMGCRDLCPYCSGIIVGTNFWSSVG